MGAKIIFTWLTIVAALFIFNLETALCQYSEIWKSGGLSYLSYGYSWNNDVENSADVNGDGIPDLWVVKNKGVDFYEGTHFNLIWQLTTTYASIYSVGLADTDGDGVIERIFLEGSSNPSVGRVRIYDNVTHVMEWLSDEIEGISFVHVADVNGDGKSEMIITTIHEQDSCVVHVYKHTGSEVVEGNERENKPEKNRLSQNYPNPFNPETSINYELQTDGIVTITIFNSLGQQVRVLFNGNQRAGEYSIVWDGGNDEGQRVASGLYFYQLSVNNYTSSKKMVLLR